MRILTELEKQIEARKKEAKDKKIWEKLELIVQYLGTGIGVNGRYENYSLTIMTHFFSSQGSGNTNIKVYSENDCVFHASSGHPINIMGFIPGDWEKILDRLYADAKISPKKKKEEDFLKKSAELQLANDKKRWGL